MSIRLDRIVTRGGDQGQTSLGDGSRVSKDCARIDAMGTVDELNALLGILEYYVRKHGNTFSISADIRQIQSCLFDLGADICIPDPARPSSLTDKAVAWIESCIELLRVSQPELRSFILPGGSLISAHAHLARTVARRAERSLISLDPVPAEGIRFLNRLSDYFFVLARHANDDGAGDVLWQPGQWK
ncbi:cob(I)yrinic acid a c-diamide adenosyltransferase [Gluconobacter thailandicus]|uniref:cob(I)yrinic acid a,c-diamide adenosyltransferase n=1 Tax=Gluconobacter thailandicus TaxID=257438 RepID=UPI000776EF0D|nr:cob(I)yrinic acid a,c-diamide adenosyltransferase [Gluconobacter thailandicus]KXV34594.1 cob(I)yrinic acid a c-diamide adenosyltransferase [Gluconobacter thailandicus]